MYGKAFYLVIISLIIFFLGLFFFGTYNSKNPNPIDLTPYSLELPHGFPNPIIPKDNQLTQARVAFGKKLFYDPILSRDSSVSCSTCHQVEKAFADNNVITKGVDGRLGFRNAPTLANVAYQGRLNKDGGVVKLDMQAVVPIEDHEEMDIPVLEVVERLKNHPEYVGMSEKAYGKIPSPFTITRALGAFERTLISGDSRYDQFFYQGKKAVLTEREKRGMKLFFSKKTNCSQCHSGFNFTNNDYKNNGLREDYSDDKGRQRITLAKEDIGKFRVPTLRNIALTYPYMSDGSVSTLEEVVEHYNNGGSGHPNKSKLIRPLKLGDTEKADLVFFLNTLTDSSFIKNQNFY